MQDESCRGIYEIAHVFRDDSADSSHLSEFTMVEWYNRNFSYLDLINEVVEILKQLSKIKSGEHKITDLDRYQVLSVSDIFFITYQIQPKSNWGYEDYLEIANARKLIQTEIACKSDLHKQHLLMEIFSLLYDFAVQQYCRENSGLLFIKDYPAFLRGMAELSKEGWAMRVEAYLDKLEICSGYQELSNADELKNVWHNNNNIREFLGKKANPVDLELLEISRHMKDVSGMAIGLERALMALYNISDIQSFKLYRFV